ncbi:hypothetical protein [Shewanella algae]|uniref:hypothetical protein n=1 Tax=Shewanella algae TaxID=38313 RepID=UPI00313F07B8
MTKISMLIRTPSLKNDDRVRKESTSLAKHHEVRVVSFENGTSNLEGYYPGVYLSRKRMHLRKIFPSGKFVLFKIVEMYFKYLVDCIKYKPNVIWLHNFEMLGLVFLFAVLKKLRLINSKIAWDEHELPPEIFLKNSILKSLYSYCIRSCDLNFIAESARGDYVNNALNIKTEYISIDNYPDFTFLNENSKPLGEALNNWLNGDDFFLCQSGARIDRAMVEIVNAALQVRKKVVFVGPYNKNQVNELLSKNVEFNNYVYFEDSVPQMRLVDYIERCIATIVFYKKSSMNNWLCAPNRLYLSLARGKPVISGNNPVFKRVEKDNNVIVCNTDGDDCQLIAKALDTFDASKYTNVHNQFLWENVELKIQDKVKNVI